jgi:hypothetical protein
MSEHDEQVAIVRWALNQGNIYPGVELLYATPNAGKRTPRMGAYMKAEGLRPGFPDLGLPVAKGGYHGLFMELKMVGNKPNKNQIYWLDRLNEQGYMALAVWMYDGAIKVLEDYMTLEDI